MGLHHGMRRGCWCHLVVPPRGGKNAHWPHVNDMFVTSPSLCFSDSQSCLHNWRHNTKHNMLDVKFSLRVWKANLEPFESPDCLNPSVPTSKPGGGSIPTLAIFESKQHRFHWVHSSPEIHCGVLPCRLPFMDNPCECAGTGVEVRFNKEKQPTQQLGLHYAGSGGSRQQNQNKTPLSQPTNMYPVFFTSGYAYM